MTMIVRIENGKQAMENGAIRAYIGNEQAGIATPLYIEESSWGDDPLYFLTISSDAAGEIRFETEDGTILTPAINAPITYVPDAHHGSIKAPVILTTGDDRPYKIIENEHVVIIRNNDKYDVTGKKL